METDKIQTIIREELGVMEEDNKNRGVIEFSLYSFSSFTSFILDYLCYIITLFLFKNIILSNIISRLISSIYNYLFNKNIVFKYKDYKSLCNYYILAITILIINTISLKLLIKFINPYISKIIIEIISFIINYIIQKKYIFKGSGIYKK